MTKYSPIAPIQILQQLITGGLLDNYLLLLAHDVLKYPDAYRSLVEVLRHPYEHGEAFIIMDNGTVENGAPVPLADLLEAANLVEADCVIGPDVIGDFEGTKRLCEEQVEAISQDFPVMFVPQGASPYEIYRCVDWYLERFPSETRADVASYFGVPRWIANEWGTRGGTISCINKHAPQPAIHLLGTSENPINDLVCCSLPNVMGIDSANPLVLGHNGIEITRDYTHPERGDYWENTELTELMANNVKWMHDVVNRG